MYNDRRFLNDNLYHSSTVLKAELLLFIVTPMSTRVLTVLIRTKRYCERNVIGKTIFIKYIFKMLNLLLHYRYFVYILVIHLYIMTYFIDLCYALYIYI